MDKLINNLSQEVNENRLLHEPRTADYEIFDGTNPSKVNLDSLLDFEVASWPEEEMAGREDLEKRLNEFPEGISMLFDTDHTDGRNKAMAQFTMAPKEIPSDIKGFEQMRDLPVSLESSALWGTNIARRIGAEYSGKGYASQLVESRLMWAKDKGYSSFVAGVTCDGLNGHVENFIDEHREQAMDEISRTGDINLPKLREQAFNSYFSQNMNPATKLFERAANKLGLEIIIGEPIKDYWPVNETSLGYGVMVEIVLNNFDKTETGESENIEFSFDLNKPELLGIEGRETATGNEQTMFCYLPAKGCPNNCEFCSVKHIKAENFAPSIEQSVIASEKIRKFINENPETDTVKIFNAGNILHGTEFGERCELHEYFWDKLPEVLADLKEKGARINAIEIEVRVDELDPESQAAHRNEIAARLIRISEGLEKVGVKLRVLLALEYIDQEIIDKQGKFAKTSEYEQTVSRTLGYLKTEGVETLAYAMFGGRNGDRPMHGDEAVKATFNTIDFALADENNPREVIVNWQYLDPIQQKREQKEGKLLYVPAEEDAKNLLLLLWNKMGAYQGRVRISYQPEDTIVGTTGAVISDEFKSVLDRFNNASDQHEYLSNYFA